MGMVNLFNLPLLKAENPEAYKKLAERGVMVGFPVSIAGQTHRPDIKIPYHSTVKFFNPDKDTNEAIHGVASKLNLTPPNPKETHIEPGVLKDRAGNDVYVIKLHGKHADAITEHNSKFSHMGFPANFKYQPHISVDKGTWDKISQSGAKTAHEAGIDFGHAELRQGHSVVAKYGPKKTTEDPLAASEDMKKGLLHNVGIAAGMTAALATGAAAPEHRSEYSSGKMLRAIASVESNSGQNQHHKVMGSGESAFGKYGLTPNVIRETIHMTPDLKAHKKAAALQGDNLKHYMQDNPGLEDAVAQHHLKRLEHHFGGNPSDIGYSWLNGITGTYKAKKSGKNVSEHWHAKKVKDAYLKGK